MMIRLRFFALMRSVRGILLRDYRKQRPAMAATGRAITIRFCSAAPEPTTTYE